MKTREHSLQTIVKLLSDPDQDLYTVAERKRRSREAPRFNALVRSWSEVAHLARERGARPAQQTTMFRQE